MATGDDSASCLIITHAITHFTCFLKMHILKKRSEWRERQFRCNIEIFHHLFELNKRNLPIEITVCFDYCPVYQLLQLYFCQISTYHHLQHTEEITVRDVVIFINIVDFEGKRQFSFFIVGVELRESSDKLLEADRSVFIGIEY